MSSTPISDYALLSDSRSSALVSKAGAVDWLCFRRFDAPPVLCRLLGSEAGHFSIALRGDPTVERRYVGETMVLETTFETASGTLVLTDAMAIAPGTGHDLGSDAPEVLVRRARCERGEVEVLLDYQPRLEYGSIMPLVWAEDGVVRARGGADRLSLSGQVPFVVEGPGATASFTLEAGQHETFALRHRSSWEEPAPPISQRDADALLDGTIEAWLTWSGAHEQYVGTYADQVRASGRVLQALTFQPTGAMVAAVTTSLPETIGGERNWDYRYSWVRDASFTLQALYRSTCPDEAHRFFEWIAEATSAGLRAGNELQIMFGVGGEHDLSERTLPHLPGYRGSAPVRVGNAAWDQRQLDVYGEVLDAAATYDGRFDPPDQVSRRFLAAAADAAAARWREEDESIWEFRGGRRQFLYSKLMCWVALDRAIAMAQSLEALDRVEAWRDTRAEIREEIETRGWSEAARSFTQTLDTNDLDASALMISIVGFLPPDDPRVLSTIDAVVAGLSDERGLLYRYRTDDGMEGEEGTFLLCTFWLAQAQAMAGRLDDARTTFERAMAYRNDVGLLAEEVDPVSGALLGNFPQAFSHIGLINAATAIRDAEDRREGRTV